VSRQGIGLNAGALCCLRRRRRLGVGGELTDDDLERVVGKADQFIGLLQQKYGYTRGCAEEEINKRLEAAKIH